MSATKVKTRPAQTLAAAAALPGDANQEVLTLAEAAAYLRVGEADLLALVSRQDFPARQIGKEWRFLKSALEDWLRTPPARPNQASFLALAGTCKDDPDLEDIVREAYRKRGRPITEEGK
jgi:excisionase family DNA binding protein